MPSDGAALVTAAAETPAAVPSTTLDTRRKLHLGHFAFMRAAVQGVDPAGAWDRYLQIEGNHGNARTVRRTLAWIRDAFAAAARRERRPGTAKLVLINIDKLPPAPAETVSLEAFISTSGLEGFSQRDQLAAFEHRYGNASKLPSRRARLMVKQLAALRWLEELIAQPPAAGDPIVCWINPDLAAHLNRAGLLTLRQLIDHINGSGKRWHTMVPAIGAGKAQRITDWLGLHEASLGLPLGSHVRVTRAQLGPGQLARVVPRQTGIVPLTKLIVPRALGGHNGRFRAPLKQCMPAATNDYEAVLIWIRTRHGILPDKKAFFKLHRQIYPDAPELPLDWFNYLSHTQRAYLKEAERFMLWAIVQHQKPLSSMAMEGCEQYRQFLGNPSRWSSECRAKAIRAG